jgi:UDP-N-acetylmuramoyl-L-alanyl-D-glutamate--2,6-diaminopimelate ligase
VFGCGGDRDQGKRPLMAQAAEKHADFIILTNDNPRHEQPLEIVEQIKAGFASQTQVSVQIDRKLAISETLAQANNDDIVLIAGKGHETYQIFGDDVIEYDERAYVRQCCVGKTSTGNEDVTS